MQQKNKPALAGESSGQKGFRKSENEHGADY